MNLFGGSFSIFGQNLCKSGLYLISIIFYNHDIPRGIVLKTMGISKYDELVSQVLNYLDNRDWDSAYSLLKNKELQDDAAAIAVLSEFYINGLGVY